MIAIEGVLSLLLLDLFDPSWLLWVDSTIPIDQKQKKRPHISVLIKAFRLSPDLLGLLLVLGRAHKMFCRPTSHTFITIIFFVS